MIATRAQRLKTSLASPAPALRMDLLANPFAPLPDLRGPLCASDAATLPDNRLETILVARIARYHRVAPGCIETAADIAGLLLSLFRVNGPNRPLIVFPPTGEIPTSVALGAGLNVIEAPRDRAFHVRASALPSEFAGYGVAYVMSPNDPTGTQLRLQDAVSIARSVALLIIDERHSAYAARDHLPLHREFDNVVLVRSLQTWGGLTDHPFSYAIAHPEIARELRACSPRGSIDTGSLLAGIRSFEHSRYLDAAARQVTRERVALVRALRKLNMVRPLPSPANFVLVKLERGHREDLRGFLDCRGIAVHYPTQSGLEDTIRVSAVSAAATRALCEALISWARDL